MKKCFKCGTTKQLSEFYKEKGRKDGRSVYCRKCACEYGKKRYEEYVKDSPEKHTDKYRDTIRERDKVYAEKYPEKREAKEACRELLKLKDHKHHWSYNHEHYTDIIHLTIREHGLIHRVIEYDKNKKMYRNLKGDLLDSKESHLELLIECVE